LEGRATYIPHKIIHITKNEKEHKKELKKKSKLHESAGAGGPVTPSKKGRGELRPNGEDGPDRVGFHIISYH
jgi:hypothetical protein